GMRVRSIYDPKHEFVIDRSILPERVYREKGTKRWWAKRDLEGLIGRSKPLSAKKEEALLKARSLAFQAIPTALSPKGKPLYRRTCPECGLEFTTEQQKQKFSSDACRTKNWKRRNEIPEIPKERLRSQRGDSNGQRQTDNETEASTEATRAGATGA